MKSIVLALALLLITALTASAACTTGIPYQAKADFLAGVHLTTDTYKVATFTSSATYGPAGAATYSATNEVSGTGYTAGGFALAAPTAQVFTATGVIDFPDDVNNTVTFTGGECSIVYNTSKSNKIIFVQQHAAASPAAVTVTYDFPTAGASTSLLRIVMDAIFPPAYAADGGVTIMLEGANLLSDGGF